MSEREEDGRRRGDRGSRDRERDSERHTSHRKRSRDRDSSHSRSRSRSPHRHKRSHHRHRDDTRERHSSRRKHKRHRDDKHSHTRSSHSSGRRQSRSPSATSLSSASSASVEADRPDNPSRPLPPPFPSAASLEAARSILASLLSLDPASHDDLLFLVFQLDHSHSIIIQHIAHPQARQYLQQLVRLLGLQRTREEGGEEGWRVWDEWGERKLLPELESVFDAVKRGATKRSSPAVEKKVDNVPAAEVQRGVESVHPAAVIGPALPPPSYRPSTNQQQQQLSPHVFDEQGEQEAEHEDGADSYGPRLASQLTADEIDALDRLQRARQQLNDTKQHVQQLRSSSSASTGSPSSHEEWMTVVPAAMSGQAALMASMTGDRAMKGRSFAVHDTGSRGERDSGWMAGPEEREWRRVERDAEKTVEKALAHLRAVQQRVHSPAAASVSSDTVGARTTAAVSSSASTAAPSLLELHQERLRAAQSSVTRKVVGEPIFWDREKEMGMRRHKTDKQIAGELRGANELSSRFAMANT